MTKASRSATGGLGATRSVVALKDSGSSTTATDESLGQVIARQEHPERWAELQNVVGYELVLIGERETTYPRLRRRRRYLRKRWRSNSNIT